MNISKIVNELKIPVVILIVLFGINYVIPDRRDNGTQISSNVRVYYESGEREVLRVRHSSYAGLSIHQTRGSHRLSTWEYCMYKGMARCEVTVKYAVYRFKYVN